MSSEYAIKPLSFAKTMQQSQLRRLSDESTVVPLDDHLSRCASFSELSNASLVSMSMRDLQKNARAIHLLPKPQAVVARGTMDPYFTLNQSSSSLEHWSSVMNMSNASLLDKSLRFGDLDCEDNESKQKKELQPGAHTNTATLLDMSVASSLLEKSLTFSDYYGDNNQGVDGEEGRQVVSSSAAKVPTEELLLPDDSDSESLEDSVQSPAMQEKEQKQKESLNESHRDTVPMLVAKDDEIVECAEDRRRAQFATHKSMSVARMEMTVDTVIKAHERPEFTEMKKRRLSFGYVMQQGYDKAIPACAVVQGWVDRIDEWDPNPTKGDKINSKPTKIKSILKKMKKRLSFGSGRRGSFFGNKKVQANAPKQPGRRGSFQRGLWTVAVRRGSFWGSDTNGDNCHGNCKNNNNIPKSATEISEQGKAPIGRLFGPGGRRFSSGGSTECANSPPQKPDRRLSQAGIEIKNKARRGSFLGRVARRFSNGGSRFVSSSVDAPLSPPLRRRRSWLIGGNDTKEQTDAESAGGDKTIGTKACPDSTPKKPQRNCSLDHCDPTISSPEGVCCTDDASRCGTQPSKSTSVSNTDSPSVNGTEVSSDGDDNVFEFKGRVTCVL